MSIIGPDVGVRRNSDLKMIREIAELYKKDLNLLENKVRRLKNAKKVNKNKLIAGVDYIHTNLGNEKYTPVGIRKILEVGNGND